MARDAELDRLKVAQDVAFQRKQNAYQAQQTACVKAFKTRLEQVRASSKKRREDKKSIAEKAGVPLQYRDNVWISKESDGNINIYFGGEGKPNGPGCGYYILRSNGRVVYQKMPSNVR